MFTLKMMQCMISNQKLRKSKRVLCALMRLLPFHLQFCLILFLCSCYTGNPYPYQPPYMTPRYIRNPPPPNDSTVPTYQDSYSNYVPERPYPPPHSGPAFSQVSTHGFPPPPHYDSRRHTPYPGHPPPQPFAPPRDEMVRMSPVPVDGPPAGMPPPQGGAPGSLYHPDARERYPPEGYPPPGPHHGQMRQYVRVRTDGS